MLIVCLVLLLWKIESNYEKSEASNNTDVSSMSSGLYNLMLTPAMFWLTLMLFCDGMSRGVIGEYVPVDLEQNLNVTSTMLGERT